MIDHVSLAVSNLSAAATFYDDVLAPLGLRRIATRARTIGYGKRYPEFWLNLREEMAKAPADTGAHVCLRASSEEAVRTFHDRALASGGRSDGEPGLRSGAVTDYFGAFIRDIDGNKVEAITFPPSIRTSHFIRDRRTRT